MEYIKTFQKLCKTNDYENFDLFMKSLNANQFANILHRLFSKVIKEKISFTLFNFSYLPIDNEDLYFEFLQNAYKFFKNYKLGFKNASLETFLKLVVGNYVLNKIKYFSREKRSNKLDVNFDDLFYISDEFAVSKINSKTNQIDLYNFFTKMNSAEKKKFKTLLNQKASQNKYYSTFSINKMRKEINSKASAFFANCK